MRERRYTEGRC